MQIASFDSRGYVGPAFELYLFAFSIINCQKSLIPPVSPTCPYRYLEALFVTCCIIRNAHFQVLQSPDQRCEIPLQRDINMELVANRFLYSSGASSHMDLAFRLGIQSA